MNRSPDIHQVLERLTCPALIVEAGIVTYANTLAQQRMILQDTPINSLISIGAEEYAHFCSGSLCLTLSVMGNRYDTTVVRNEACDIFYLEFEAASPELKAFALASQHLREPLSGALHCADLLQDSIASSGNQKLEQLNRNLHQIHRALCNMSDISNFESARPIMTHYSDATAIFTEILEKASHMVKQAGRDLVYTVPRESIVTMLDREKIERAVYNLISNAVKYSPKDTVIRANLHPNGKKLYFSIENATFQPVSSSIFSNFQRAPGLEQLYTGLGLGLTVARNAAAAHLGTLLMDQTADGFQRFTISMAICRPQGSEVRSPILLPIDYAGGYDHALLELSDILPPELYKP